MEKTKLEKKMEKLEKKLETDFRVEVQRSSGAQLKEKIVNYSKAIQEIEDAKDADEKLNALKEQIKDLSGGYRDAKKAIKDKLEYVLGVMKTNGLE